MIDCANGRPARAAVFAFVGFAFVSALAGGLRAGAFGGLEFITVVYAFENILN
jgi:hypothetical protein